MGISSKISQMATNVQVGVKNTSISLFSLTLKLFTGFFIGLTLALIGQEMMGFGVLGFMFMMVVTMGLIVRALLKWSVGAVLVFDLIAVLVALLLRMYILIAP